MSIIALIFFVVAGLCVFLLPVMVIMAGVAMFRRHRRARTLDRDEESILTKVSEGLERMEQRVESLETILLERDRRRSGNRI